MRKYILAFFLMVLYLSAVSCKSVSSDREKDSHLKKTETQTKVRHLDMTDFRVEQKTSMLPISIYENFQNVIEKFGSPKRNYHPKESEQAWTCLEYDSFSVYYHTHAYSQNILWLKVFDDTFATPRGVSVGDKVSKVFKLYNVDDITMGTLNTGETFCFLEISTPTENPNKPPFVRNLYQLYFFYEDEIINKIYIEFVEEI